MTPPPGNRLNRGCRAQPLALRARACARHPRCGFPPGDQAPSTSTTTDEKCCEHERRRRVLTVDGGSDECGAVEVMEDVWPSGIALRGEASNRPQVHWLKTVVLNVVGKGSTRSGQVRVGKMSDGRESSAVDVSKVGKMTSKPGLHFGLGISLGVTRLLPRRRPAYRQHEPDLGSSTAG